MEGVTVCITTIPGRSWWFRRASDSARTQTISHQTLYVLGDPDREQGYVSGRIARSRNVGLDRCKTEWIAYLDDDNYWTSNHLESLLRRKDNAEIVYTPSVKVFTDHTHSCEVQLDGFDPNASLINVAYAKSIGGWEENWIPSEKGMGWIAAQTGLFYEDLDFWARAEDDGARIVRAAEATWAYTLGPRPEKRMFEARSIRNWKLDRPMK